jgi:hypothetical protein
MNNAEKKQFEPYINVSVDGYKIAVDRGVTDISPNDALEASLRLKPIGMFRESTLADSLQLDDEGQAVLEELGDLVIQKIEEAEHVDQQG